MQHVTSLQYGLIKKNREVKEEVVESQEKLSNRSFCRIHEEDLDLYFKFSPAWFIHFVWRFCYNCIENMMSENYSKDYQTSRYTPMPGVLL